MLKSDSLIFRENSRFDGVFLPKSAKNGPKMNFFNCSSNLHNQFVLIFCIELGMNKGSKITQVHFFGKIILLSLAKSWESFEVLVRACTWQIYTYLYIYWLVFSLYIYIYIILLHKRNPGEGYITPLEIFRGVISYFFSKSL